MPEDRNTLAWGGVGKIWFMLHSRADLQITVEPNHSSSKLYILCYHLVALLYSLPDLCFLCTAPGKAHRAAVTLGLHKAAAGRLGTEATS